MKQLIANYIPNKMYTCVDMSVLVIDQQFTYYLVQILYQSHQHFSPLIYPMYVYV